MKRLSYDDVYNTIALYAPEMLPSFADHWSRFPQGGQAAMIVNYLNDTAQRWYDIDTKTARSIADAGAEIIFRAK